MRKPTRPHTREAIAALLVLFAPGALPNELDSASHEAKQIAWVERGKHAIRAMLTDPSSARFRNVSFFQGGGIPVACGEVTARDSFDRYEGYQRFVAAGDTVAALENQSEDFPNLWHSLCVD